MFPTLFVVTYFKLDFSWLKLYNFLQIFYLSFSFSGVEFKNKMVGQEADGASVNRGDKSGVKTKVLGRYPMVGAWLVHDP